MTTSTERLSVEERRGVEWECQRLSVAVAYCLDRCLFDEMMAYLTEDVVFDRAGPVVTSRAELRAAMEQRPDITTRHCLSNFHFVTTEAGRAEAVVTAMTYHTLGSPSDEVKPFATQNGRLLDMHTIYENTDDGWRISSIIAKPVMVTPDWPGF
jgi:SnoaL-like domain